MKKKIFIISTLIIALVTYGTTFSNANSNMINTVEDSAKNVTSDVGGAVERGGEEVKNAADGMMTGTEDAMDKVTDKVVDSTGYTATRTSTGDVTFLGMNATAWTWLIMGILAVAIIALVWYYGAQKEKEINNSNT